MTIITSITNSNEIRKGNKFNMKKNYKNCIEKEDSLEIKMEEK